MQRFVNLTPHDVVIINGDEKFVIPKSGTIARLSQSYIDCLYCDVDSPIKFFKTEYGDIEFFGNKVDLVDKIVVVSALFEKKAKELIIKFGARMVVVPDTGRAIRDENGKILGVPGLIVVAE